MDFVGYAREYPELQFQVTAIGTGLAGYTHEQIAPMFDEAPGNCVLPVEWRAQPYLQGHCRHERRLLDVDRA